MEAINLNNLTWKQVAIFVSLIAIALFPLLHSNNYILHVFILFFIWSIVVVNWNLILGYAGIWCFANVAFMVIGAYTSGMLSKSFGISPWVCIFIGGISSMIIVTLFIGLPALRLSGIYICLLSLLFFDSIGSILTQTRKYTGGAMGLHNIPPLFNGIERIHAYYLAYALFLIILIIIYKVIHSSTGLAFIALRDDNRFATSLGISEYKEKLKVFALSAFFTGIAGGFFAHYNGDISPATLGIEPFLLAVAMILIGGLGRFPGSVIGAIIIVFGNEFFRLAGTLRFAILGAMICTIILFFSGGFMEFVDFIDRWNNRRRNIHNT
jgi:branched-chain amino acid transport system permease protein